MSTNEKITYFSFWLIGCCISSNVQLNHSIDRKVAQLIAELAPEVARIIREDAYRLRLSADERFIKIAVADFVHGTGSGFKHRLTDMIGCNKKLHRA